MRWFGTIFAWEGAGDIGCRDQYASAGKEKEETGDVREGARMCVRCGLRRGSMRRSMRGRR